MGCICSYVRMRRQDCINRRVEEEVDRILEKDLMDDMMDDEYDDRYPMEDDLASTPSQLIYPELFESSHLAETKENPPKSKKPSSTSHRKK